MSFFLTLSSFLGQSPLFWNSHLNGVAHSEARFYDPSPRAKSAFLTVPASHSMDVNSMLLQNKCGDMRVHRIVAFGFHDQPVPKTEDKPIQTRGLPFFSLGMFRWWLTAIYQGCLNRDNWGYCGRKLEAFVAPSCFRILFYFISGHLIGHMAQSEGQDSILATYLYMTPVSSWTKYTLAIITNKSVQSVWRGIQPSKAAAQSIKVTISLKSSGAWGLTLNFWAHTYAAETFSGHGEASIFNNREGCFGCPAIPPFPAPPNTMHRPLTSSHW